MSQDVIDSCYCCLKKQVIDDLVGLVVDDVAVEGHLIPSVLSAKEIIISLICSCKRKESFY